MNTDRDILYNSKNNSCFICGQEFELNEAKAVLKYLEQVSSYYVTLSQTPIDLSEHKEKFLENGQMPLSDCVDMVKNLRGLLGEKIIFGRIQSNLSDYHNQIIKMKEVIYKIEVEKK